MEKLSRREEVICGRSEGEVDRLKVALEPIEPLDPLDVNFLSMYLRFISLLLFGYGK